MNNIECNEYKKYIKELAEENERLNIKLKKYKDEIIKLNMQIKRLKLSLNSFYGKFDDNLKRTIAYAFMIDSDSIYIGENEIKETKPYKELQEKFDYQYKAYVDRGVVIDKLSREIMLLKNEQSKIIKECTELKKDYVSYKKDVIMDLENFVDYVRQNSEGDCDDED